MLDARFSHLYFCQSLYTLQRGLATIADLLVFCVSVSCYKYVCIIYVHSLYVLLFV